MMFGATPFASTPFSGATSGGGIAGGLSLQIGGDDVSSGGYLLVDSYRVSEQLNGRDTAECTLYIPDAWAPTVGARFILTHEETRLFGGTVERWDWEFVAESNDQRFCRVTAIDHNQIPDRFIVAKVYTNMAAGAIVRNLVEEFLAVEGVTVGSIPNGPTLAKVVFPNITVTEALDQLHQQTGYNWEIDSYRTMNWFYRDALMAPFPIVDGVNAIWRNMRASQDRGGYRNVQFVDGGKGRTSAQTEFFSGDNKRRTFVVGFEIAAQPTVSLDGVPQTVGIGGIDSNAQWTWNQGNNTVSQQPSATPLTAAQTLAVTYIGWYDLFAGGEKPEEIERRKQIEGGSGRYEAVVRDDSLDGNDVVDQYIQDLLRINGQIAWDVDFETDTPGLAVGQQLRIDVPQMGMSLVDVLITAMETWPFAIGRRRYRVTATSGELRNTMKQFWSRVFKSGKPITINEDATVQQLITLASGAAASDELTVTLSAAHIGVFGEDIVGGAQWGV